MFIKINCNLYQFYVLLSNHKYVCVIFMFQKTFTYFGIFFGTILNVYS